MSVFRRQWPHCSSGESCGAHNKKKVGPFAWPRERIDASATLSVAVPEFPGVDICMKYSERESMCSDAVRPRPVFFIVLLALVLLLVVSFFVCTCGCWKRMCGFL